MAVFATSANHLHRLAPTAADLGLGPKIGSPPGARTKAVNGAKPVRFRDEAGNTWVGRGPRPQWVQDALASGKKLGDFAV